MHVSETLIDGNPELYEQRYSVWIGKSEMPMVRRPMAIEPPDGTVCWVDNGPRVGVMPKQSAGHYKGGKWLKVRFEPTHWTHWEMSDG